MVPMIEVRTYWHDGEVSAYKFYTFAAALDCAREMRRMTVVCPLVVVCDQSAQLPLFDWSWWGLPVCH